MLRQHFISLAVSLIIICSVPLCAENPAGNIPGKAQGITNAGPQSPSGAGQTAVKPAEPGGSGNPPAETPSGAQPADPAAPGENPATPADPGDKETPDKDKKDKKDKDSKDKKEKHAKSGKSGGGQGGSLPSGVPTPQSGGASLLPAAGGIIGGILSGGKKNEDKKEEKPKPALKEAVVSSDTVKSTATVQSSAPAVAAEPLYSQGKGPKIAVIDFEGEHGAQFAQLLAEALKADLKVYSRKELAAGKYKTEAVTRVSAKKIAAEAGVDYIVTGKINKKTETLSIISVFLRDGGTGDIKMTDYPKLKSAEDLKSTAEAAAGKIKERIK